MKQSSHLKKLSVLSRMIADMITIPFVVVLAYSLKFKIGWTFYNVLNIKWGVIYSHAQFEPYVKIFGILTTLWIITFYFFGLYKNHVGIMPEVDEFILIFKSVLLIIFEVTALSFLMPNLIPESRYVLIYIGLFSIILFPIQRLLIRRLEIKIFSKALSKKTLIVGANEQGQDIAERLVNFPLMGYQYVGHLANKKPEKIHFHLLKHFTILGKSSDLTAAIKEYNIKAVFIARNILKRDNALIEFCKTNKIELHFSPPNNPVTNSMAKVVDLDSLFLISYVPLTHSLVGKLMKRVFDIVLSLLLLMLLSPIFIGIMVIIKLVSPSGPVFYFQERVTKDNRIFNMIKFRTMIPNAETKSGPIMVNEGQETRYIKYGEFLRKTSLDELPQLINVIIGDMSLVGPRPERPFFVEQFKQQIPNFENRHKMKAGITGWAQVNGRSVLTRRPEHKFKYDLYYIKNWSFVLDIKILLKTIETVLNREEAY